MGRWDLLFLDFRTNTPCYVNLCEFFPEFQLSIFKHIQKISCDVAMDQAM